jgi:hypothetical protein
MAGKKPAKVNSSNKTVQPTLPGKATYYMAALKGVFHVCPKCSKKTGRGIVYENQNELYCSRRCVTAA